MKYRKKPVVIEAVQLLWSTWGEMCGHADVGRFEHGKPEGCYVDANGNAHTDGGAVTGMKPTTVILPRGDIKVEMSEPRLGLRIPTLEGTMLAIEGDWVIRGIKGELYPCKDDIFAATYDAVDD